MKTPDHILVTGAGGAIGGEIARQFARRFPAATLTLVDRNEAAVSACAQAIGPQARVALWDLSRPDALQEPWQALVAASGPVDILVNCAGIMEIVSFSGSGWDMGSRMLAINLLSPLRLMDLAIHDMVARGSGGVINVSSMAGRVPIRGCSYYGASKAGICMASEIARNELRGSGVRVLTVYPGPVHSGLESHARAQVRPGFVSRAIPTGKPAVIAAQVVEALLADKARVIYPFSYRVANFFIDTSSWFTTMFSPEPSR